MSNPADELVEIVDRDNNPIGAVSRRIMRQQNLIHRASYILVFNRRRRTVHPKKITGRKISIPVTGTWRPVGWCWLARATRNRRCENWGGIGGTGVTLRPLFDQYFEDDKQPGVGPYFFLRQRGAVHAPGRGNRPRPPHCPGRHRDPAQNRTGDPGRHGPARAAATLIATLLLNHAVLFISWILPHP